MLPSEKYQMRLAILKNHKHLAACIEITHSIMEDGRSMTTLYYYSVNHQSGLQRNTYHIFFNKSKCDENYVISFEVYDGFIGQKILKL